MDSVVLAKRLTAAGGLLESEMNDEVAGEAHCKQTHVHQTNVAEGAEEPFQAAR